MDDDLALFGVFIEVACEVFVDDLFDESANFAVSKLGFGLPFKLGLREFDADDGHESFAAVVAGKVALFFGEEVVGGGVGVEGTGEGCAEAEHMGSALGGVDVVGDIRWPAN